MRYVPARRFTPGSNLVPARVVVHGTTSATGCGIAYNVAVYFQSTAAGGSAHLVSDPCETIRCLPDGTIAHHAPPNTRSLGIELTDPVAGDAARWDDTDHERLLARAAAEVREWCLTYGIPMRKIGPVELRAGEHGVCGHIDVSQAWRLTDHWDPGPTFPWARFMAMVRDEHAEDDEENDMTPDQAKQLATVATTSARAADQASAAALYAAGANRRGEIALSWLAHGGIRAGITEIYRSRLGRDPDDDGMTSWSQVATRFTFDEIDARIAATPEAARRRVGS